MTPSSVRWFLPGWTLWRKYVGLFVFMAIGLVTGTWGAVGACVLFGG